MAIEFDGKGNIVGTTPDGAIAVKLYSLEKQIAELKSQLQQKENIIREAREYIEPIVELDNDIMLKGKMLKPVLEILDKANDREDK